MTEEEPLKYQSLLAIRARKAQLRKDIQRSEQEIKSTWDSIFHPKADPVPKTPAQRFISLASSSVGLIDGAMLGWKLYKKFIRK